MPVDYLVKKDPRTRLIRTAMNSFKAAKKSGGAKKIKKVVEAPEKNVVPQDNAGEEHDEDDGYEPSIREEGPDEEDARIDEVPGQNEDGDETASNSKHSKSSKRSKFDQF